ncbi:hypothetical protein [Streptomyces hoynatensis]|uniref:hypothetical protein n=1 Tax=Streptomyces hoynatensis TaxID=1141874 RepID=UPI00187F69F6|nr:hypothetical protein [Streptomyces hoynatensis]
MADTAGRPGSPSPWWGAGLGLLLLLAAAWAFALLPGRLADRDAYASAAPCPAAAPSAECLGTSPATVAGTEDDPHGKSVRYWLLFTEPGTDTVRRVRMTGDNVVYDAVRPGDEVTLTRWRGEVRAVRFGEAVQETAAAPSDDWRLPLGIGLGLLPFGLLVCGLAGWSWYRRRHGPPGPADARWVTVGSAAGAVESCVGVPAGMGSADVGQACVVMAAAVPFAVAVGLAAGWWLRRRTRAAADVGGLVPVTPTERRNVPATVYGEVPYSVDGYGYLVVGDGPVAATPDPQGGFAARPLPGTLTVRRARALEPGDPASWAGTYRFDAIVLECGDGERPVRVVCRRRDAPLLLGALTAAAAPGAAGPGRGGARGPRGAAG